MRNKSVVLDGNHFNLEDALDIANGSQVSIHKDVKKKVLDSRRYVEKIANDNHLTYGINTGFGYLAKQKIKTKDLNQLQVNILKSHASGYGPPLSIEETRIAMALRLNVLLKGYSGVTYELCETLCQLINKQVYPIIPEYGSVGASGDLAPLSHLALPLIGEGKVRFKGKVVSASKALKEVKITPHQLSEKEGLGLINGTQVMLAVGTLPFAKAGKLLDLSDQITALTYEALLGNPAALDPLIHQARGHKGQITSAKNIRDALSGSYLFDSKTSRERVQDPYSMRCAPQIHGPARDALTFVESVLTKEWNGATDNPLIFSQEDKVISGGNFHGQYLAIAFDLTAMTLAEIGSVSERRLELLLNPHLSGLPAFLTPNNGLNSGYMAMQYLSASLVNENKLLANPSSTDSIPGNVGIEDHVSMGMTSARKFRKLIENLQVILAIELVAAAQGCDLRGVKKFGKKTKNLYQALRKQVKKLTNDRIISTDVEKSTKVIQELL